jgi:hypothetical protein
MLLSIPGEFAQPGADRPRPARLLKSVVSSLRSWRGSSLRRGGPKNCNPSGLEKLSIPCCSLPQPNDCQSASNRLSLTPGFTRWMTPAAPRESPQTAAARTAITAAKSSAPPPPFHPSASRILADGRNTAWASPSSLCTMWEGGSFRRRRLQNNPFDPKIRLAMAADIRLSVVFQEDIWRWQSTTGLSAPNVTVSST